MTNRDVYKAALGLASERQASDQNTDYEERACFLLPVVCARCARLDSFWRAANDEEPHSLPESCAWSLDADFPLSAPFASPASVLLASLLVLEENPTLSDALSELGSALLEELSRAIPWQIESTVQKYESA